MIEIYGDLGTAGDINLDTALVVMLVDLEDDISRVSDSARVASTISHEVVDTSPKASAVLSITITDLQITGSHLLP